MATTMTKVTAGHYTLGAWTIRRDAITGLAWIAHNDVTYITDLTLKAIGELINDNNDDDNDDDNGSAPIAWGDVLRMSPVERETRLEELTGIICDRASHTHVSLDALSVESDKVTALWQSGEDITRATGDGYDGMLVAVRAIMEDSPLWAGLESPSAYYGARAERAGDVKLSALARMVLGNHWESGVCELHGYTTTRADGRPVACRGCTDDVDAELIDLMGMATDIIVDMRDQWEHTSNAPRHAYKCTHTVPCDAVWADVYGWATPVHVVSYGSTDDSHWSSLSTTYTGRRRVTPPVDAPAYEFPVTSVILDDETRAQRIAAATPARPVWRMRPVSTVCDCGGPVTPAPVTPAPVARVRTVVKTRAQRVQDLSDKRATLRARALNALL